MRRIRVVLMIGVVTVVAAAALAAGATAGGTTQVDGVMRVVDVGDPFDVTDDVTQVWGDLIGYWWTTTFDLGVATKSGVVTGSGTELVKGQCVHPVIGGTGAFAKAKGVIHVTDRPSAGGVLTSYTGTLDVPGISASSAKAPPERTPQSVSRAVLGGCGR
jgi:hypothetical protein